MPYMHAGSCVAEEGIRSPPSEITGSYKLFVGFWELNPGPFDAQPVILLSATSPASELFHIYFDKFFLLQLLSDSPHQANLMCVFMLGPLALSVSYSGTLVF